MNEVRTAVPEATIGGVQVSLQSVYLKDCSYESPNGPRLPNNQGWEPKFQLNMNTSAEELAADIREVLLTIGQPVEAEYAGDRRVAVGEPQGNRDLGADRRSGQGQRHRDFVAQSV